MKLDSKLEQIRKQINALLKPLKEEERHIIFVNLDHCTNCGGDNCRGWCYSDQ